MFTNVILFYKIVVLPVVIVGICEVGAPDEEEKAILAGDGNWKYVEVDPSIEADLVVVVVVDEFELNYF